MRAAVIAGSGVAALLLLTGCASGVSRDPSSGLSFVETLAAQDAVRPFRQAAVDLNGDGRDEVVLRFEGPDRCGSGGCNGLVLTPQGSGWRVVMRATVTRLPFRVLETRTHGWADLGVFVGGGGMASQEMLLAFDGASYPSNPTTPPARPSRGAPGRIILDESSPLATHGGAEPWT